MAPVYVPVPDWDCQRSGSVCGRLVRAGGAGNPPRAGPTDRGRAMTRIGYTLLGEQAGPKQLVRDAVRAEEAGFDFVAASDHHSPWLVEQGHSPYTWSVHGAAAHPTDRNDLLTSAEPRGGQECLRTCNTPG